MPAAKPPKLFDHTLIYRMVRKSATDPNWGLYDKNGRWYLIYYNRKLQTGMMCLRTSSVEDARQRRDVLCERAESIGRGAKSRQEFYAEEILRDPHNTHGLKFVVHFAGQRVVCSTREEQREQQMRIARAVIQKAKQGRAKPPREKTLDRALRRYQEINNNSQ